MGSGNICSGGLVGGVYTGDMQHTVGTPYMVVSFLSVLTAGESEESPRHGDLEKRARGEGIRRGQPSS